MRIVVITSCTGEKSVESPEALTLEDFQQGPKHVKAREKTLGSLLTPAEDLYTGQQHVRLMRGIHAFREKATKQALDLFVLSAGYGVVKGEQKLAPYEATFAIMKKGPLRKWADQLGVPKSFREALAAPYDLGLVLLGDDYLEACLLDAEIKLGGPTLLFCGGTTFKRLPKIKSLRAIPLSNPEAKRFSCGLVALKGDLAARLLRKLGEGEVSLDSLLRSDDVLTLLEQEEAPSNVLTFVGSSLSSASQIAPVDFVISLPDTWREKPHRTKLRYFIPEWDDLVDPNFDFLNERHSGGAAKWSNEVYAHQILSEPSYDGILVSREVVKKKEKVKGVNALGIHRYLRVPRSFPVMGDCGAFGYINQDTPPYSTNEVIDYYTKNDFDYGVSVDHLIVAGTESKKRERYDLTIANAEAFIIEHRKQGLPWEPMGAVQGWDADSYAKAAKSYVEMGYKYIALGGLVRTNTVGIVRLLQSVQQVVPNGMNIHLLGIARLAGIRDFVRHGATSIDNASMLRKAWLGSELNYVTPGGWYSAIRIPEVKELTEKGGSFRAKELIKNKTITFEALKRLEQTCLVELREYASRRGSVPDSLLNHLVEFDELVAGARRGTRERLLKTLADRPWEHCPCEICKRWGVEVLIFRGNNRNRRRGFHNTFVFYSMLQDTILGKVQDDLSGSGTSEQSSLFTPDEMEP